VRDTTIARNYAGALFALAEKHDHVARFGDLMAGLAMAIETDDRVRVTIESPQVPKPMKLRILERALAEHAPAEFIRFLAAVVKRGRQYLLSAIASEYQLMADGKLGRLHVGVTLAREPDEALQEAVRRTLSEVTGKEIIARFRSDPAILGGLIMRVGDRILDGSLRRRMATLRRQLLAR
jgi:F-type H+-transporting ATPase subunit delta